MGIWLDEDKLMSLSEAVKLVEDGDKVAFSGSLILREPIAAIYELIRQRRRGLHAVGTAHGFDVDLAIGGGLLKRCQYTYVAYEFVFPGGAPNYRRAIEKGIVENREDCCYTVIQGLRAAAYGLPFMPSTFFFGTDEEKLHPEYKPFNCPLTGRKLTAIPPLNLDVAIIHVHKADKHGNAVTLGPPPILDTLFTKAAEKVIITAEEIVSEEWFRENQAARIPYYEVTAVVHAPYGAHPTACYPNYAYDRDFIGEYITQARRGEEGMGEWLEKYVYSVESHEEYVKRVVEGRGEKLREWRKKKDEVDRLREELEAKMAGELQL